MQLVHKKRSFQQFYKEGGDYLLAVKQNQGGLYDQIELTYSVDRENEFKDAPYDYAKKVNKAHGRIETREYWGTSDPEYLNLIDPGGG